VAEAQGTKSISSFLDNVSSRRAARYLAYITAFGQLEAIVCRDDAAGWCLAADLGRELEIA